EDVAQVGLAGQSFGGEIRRTHQHPPSFHEADLVEEIAVLLARTESRAAPDRESEEVRKSFAVGPIHRQEDESGRCIGLRRDRLRLASAGCAGAAPSSCHGSSPCKSKMSSCISKVWLKNLATASTS